MTIDEWLDKDKHATIKVSVEMLEQFAQQIVRRTVAELCEDDEYVPIRQAMSITGRSKTNLYKLAGQGALHMYNGKGTMLVRKSDLIKFVKKDKDE